MKGITIILMATILFALGCVSKKMVDQPTKVLPLSAEACPEVSHWIGVTVKGDVASEVFLDGKLGERIIGPGDGIHGLAVEPSSGQIAYSKMLLGRNVFCPFRLYVQDRHGKHGRILFASPETIHSLNWSPSGKRLAFFVGDATNPGIWLPQQLFIVNVGADTEPMIMYVGKTTIYTPGEFCRDMAAPQIVWSDDGRSLFWIDGNRQIIRASIVSGERDRLGKADCLLSFYDNALIIARKDPWRLIRFPINGQQEAVILTLDQLEAIGFGTMIPNSSILSMIVSERQPRKYMKNPWRPTLFVDLKSGNICGRVGEPIIGYYRPSVTSRPSSLNAK